MRLVPERRGKGRFSTIVEYPCAGANDPNPKGCGNSYGDEKTFGSVCHRITVPGDYEIGVKKYDELLTNAVS